MSEEIPDEKMPESVWEKLDDAVSKVVGSIAAKSIDAALKRGQDIEIPSVGIVIMHDDYGKDRHHK